MILLVLPFQSLSLNPILTMIGTLIVGLISYALFTYIFSRQQINWFWQQLACFLPKKQK